MNISELKTGDEIIHIASRQYYLVGYVGIDVIHLSKGNEKYIIFPEDLDKYEMYEKPVYPTIKLDPITKDPELTIHRMISDKEIEINILKKLLGEIK